MPALRFRSTIEIIGVNPFVTVSAARAARLKSGWKKPMPVRIRINGKPAHAWKINMMPKGDGSFYLYLHGSVRKSSATAVGDKVEVEIEFDETYRSGPQRMPKWFAAAMKENVKATQAWKLLPPSRQKEILRYLTNLKSDEARQRNLVKTVQVLAGNKNRFMGRTWNG